MARRQRANVLTGWSMMWVICMFDLPVRTPTETRKANRFRNVLLDHGFALKQFSVYIKPCPSLDASKNLVKKFKYLIPDNGLVTFFYITDKQYLMAENFLGKNSKENEETIRRKNGQLILF